jgi:hypothetical protein
MSSPLHPQMDGQTEPVNHTLECYLPNDCTFELDNWSGMLPWADYAYNNSLTTATGMLSFFVNFAFDSQMNCPIEAEDKNPESKN